jgi:hypothetical protein
MMFGGRKVKPRRSVEGGKMLGARVPARRLAFKRPSQWDTGGGIAGADAAPAVLSQPESLTADTMSRRFPAANRSWICGCFEAAAIVDDGVADLLIDR